DDGLRHLVERVEGVKEFLLRLLALSQELDVVDEEDVALVAELAAEVRHLVITDALDELVGELLARQVDDSRRGVLGEDRVAHGVEQVRLPQPRAAVDEEWVVGAPRTLGDGCRWGGRGPGAL